MIYTPDDIIFLEPNQVFVFGSNLAGEHSGGAAKVAYSLFGAAWGVGWGMTGFCYAFPTLTQKYERRSIESLERSRDLFYKTAVHYSGLTFLLTKVGTGIASYSEEAMINLFANSPSNIIKPKGW